MIKILEVTTSGDKRLAINADQIQSIYDNPVGVIISFVNDINVGISYIKIKESYDSIVKRWRAL